MLIIWLMFWGVANWLKPRWLMPVTEWYKDCRWLSATRQAPSGDIHHNFIPYLVMEVELCRRLCKDQITSQTYQSILGILWLPTDFHLLFSSSAVKGRKGEEHAWFYKVTKWNEGSGFNVDYRQHWTLFRLKGNISLKCEVLFQLSVHTSIWWKFDERYVKTTI